MKRRHSNDRSLQHSRAQSKLPDLTIEQEADLFRRWQQDGDLVARNTLVASALKIAVAMAYKLCYRTNDYDDYVSAGSCGVMRALGKFDPAKGISFRSYAWHWIRAEINKLYLSTKFITNGGGGLRADTMFTITRLRAQYESEGLSREEMILRLASDMDQKPDVMQEWIERLDHNELSIDYVSPFNDKSLHDTIEADDATPEQAADDAEQQRRIKIQIARCLDHKRPGAVLSEREVSILRRRYMNSKIETLQEIGDSMGITRERARQIENLALEKLQEVIALDGYGRLGAKIVLLFGGSITRAA